MMFKVQCMLLIVATLVVLVAGNCIEDAREGKPSPYGEYRLIYDAEKDVTVRKIVADSIVLRNKGIGVGFSYVDDGNYEAYRQTIDGFRYCSQFRLKGQICNSRSDCRPEHLLCVVKALETFDGPGPVLFIEADTLRCEAVEAL